MNNSTSSENLIIIKPQKGWANIGFKELWAYRELVYFFVWRDIKVRYKQTLVGALWAIFQPLTAMFIFTIFFGRFAKMPSDNIPYPVFVYVGLMLWNYFSFGLTHSSDSMVSNAGIIQKIYFPRLIIPIASSLVGLIDFALTSLILIGFMAYYRFLPNVAAIFYLPVLLLLTFLSSVGLGCFFAAVNVKYRDVKFVMPFLTQMLMFLTPVIYPISMLGSKYRWLLSLNPMSGVIETARGVIFGNKLIDWNLLLYSIIVSVFLFFFGLMYFRKTERYFADII